jgi:hypothetical protein
MSNTDDFELFAASRYERFLPDLSEIGSLDLNWDHSVEYGDDGRSFGMLSLYALGHTGHRYVAACVIPKLSPEQYPIALIDEEGYTVDVFASSITTWLPCYVLYKVDGWLSTSRRWSKLSPGQPLDWLEETTEQFLSEEAALREALRGFAVPELDDLLTTLVGLVRDKATFDASIWKPAAFYKQIEGSSYVSQYRHLADSGTTSLAEWQTLIQRYPFYNRPLFHLFAEHSRSLLGEESYGEFASDSHGWRVNQRAPLTIPAELAAAVFQRRTIHDCTGTFEEDLLESAARLVKQQHYEVDAPLAPLIEYLADQGAHKWGLADAFYEAGQRWEAQGETEQQRLQALICYENAIRQCAVGEEEWHWKALARIRELAATLDDGYYQRFLEETLGNLHPREEG